MIKKLILLGLLWVSFSSFAQEDKKKEKKWDVANPGSPFNYKKHQ